MKTLQSYKTLKQQRTINKRYRRPLREKWVACDVDVCGILEESKDPTAYWRKLKQRLKKEGNETVTNCHALKMRAADGKMRLTDVPDISKHLKNIYETGEQKVEATVSKMEIVQREGKRMVNREQTLYMLKTIISVGYRVNSEKATKFRAWATDILDEYVRKGFVLDDERLKQGEAVFGEDYFRELLERVRSIRASERRIWQQITDIYAECSIDYDKNSQITHDVYAMIQNRFHYAITGQTAAEIIYTKADHTKENMGLQTWKNAPDGRVLKSDVTIAKNYLQQSEIRRLERAVTGFFDYIEDLIEDHNTFNMQQFSKSVTAFLEFRKFRILPDNGKISKAEADAKAEAEYDIFNKTQKIVSDFDREIKKMLENKQED